MDMEELADRALSLSEPWVIEGAELIDDEGIVEIRVRYDSKRGPCPECGRPCPRHDSVERRWRHLDMWSYQTWIVCRVPRFSCEEHGVRRMDVPWADGWARFTAQFECVVIDWLKVASMTATARNLGLTWDQVNGIQERAVKRGLERREAVAPKRIGVDETSFQKRHEYVTIVTDLDESRVLHVADGRGKDALDGFFEGLSADRLNAIEVVAMDMHQPYIYSAAWHVPGILEKLCFDRFHVAQLLSRAIDQTRRAESKRLASEGDDSLKSTRYLWLRSKSSLPRKLRRQLESLLDSSSSVAEVWAIKEAATKLWTYKSRTWARKAWITLCRAARKVDAPALDRAVDTIVKARPFGPTSSSPKRSHGSSGKRSHCLTSLGLQPGGRLKGAEGVAATGPELLSRSPTERWVEPNAIRATRAGHALARSLPGGLRNEFPCISTTCA